MIDIDSAEQIEKFDKANIVGSIRQLPMQLRQAWEDVRAEEVPSECPLAKNIVIAGMGGSALGGRIIDSLIPERSRVPIEVFTEFHIPSYVNENTLVIVSSYSGNTQETLSDAHEAIKRKAKVYAITTDGDLAELVEKEGIPNYKFSPKYNPSNQPRMALGYSIGAIIALLSKCEFVHITDEEIEEVTDLMDEFVKDFDIGVSSEKNIAKNITKNLKGKIPVLVASEHLVGSAHAFKNQLNENSKTFSVLFDIPELNHHLMEGLRNPALAKEYLKFLFFESELYSPSVKKRYPITKDVVEKNDVSFLTYKLVGEKKLHQIFELLVLGSFISFYLAALYEVDPSVIPWVDYFKKKLE
jgi:glucose/mannose-6-phosphate isomerase